MGITDLFKKLGAPLKNQIWSWGAVSEGGDVYLRVWQDEFRTIDGKQTVRVTHHRTFENDRENSGYKERLEHIELIRNGAKSFCVLCLAKDVNSRPREIKDFDAKMIRVGGELIQDGEDYWLEIVGTKKVARHG